MLFGMNDRLDAATASSLERGACYGFSIHSTIPLACVRSGHGPRLELTRAPHQVPSRTIPLVAEWADHPHDEPRARLYQDEQEYWLWVNRGGWTRIEPAGPRITLPESFDAAAIEEHVWTIPISLCLLHRRDLTLHAAAVEVNGRSVLMVAPGGSGKSTLAAAFVQAGHRLLSEDVSCVRMVGEPCVIPGPAMLRLRPDVLSHVVLPGARVIRQLRSRVTFALDQAHRGGCEPVPLRAIFLLEAPSEGSVGGTVPAAEGIRRLWPMAFRLPVDDWTAECFARLAELATAVPIHRFPRPVRLEQLPRAVQELTG